MPSGAATTTTTTTTITVTMSPKSNSTPKPGPKLTLALKRQRQAEYEAKQAADRRRRVQRLHEASLFVNLVARESRAIDDRIERVRGNLRASEHELGLLRALGPGRFMAHMRKCSEVDRWGDMRRLERSTAVLRASVESMQHEGYLALSSCRRAEAYQTLVEEDDWDSDASTHCSEDTDSMEDIVMAEGPMFGIYMDDEVADHRRIHLAYRARQEMQERGYIRRRH
ncbi:hypothetical protein PENSPDRAFT_669524 [Peniophora sp. CONT]|nr:hypothetical protein PENSPDRAFT_669524 [Peniophora sp. CONT]